MVHSVKTLVLHTCSYAHSSVLYVLIFRRVNIINRPTRDITGLKKSEELPGRKRISRIVNTAELHV
jgi:hypothetical protein